MISKNRKDKWDRKSISSDVPLLSQVNQLVSHGLRQAAIDLLDEAITSSPNDISLLSALGRVYLLDRQPDKAVIYLRRSHAQSNSHSAQENYYASEAFTDEDAAYLDERSEELSNEEFSMQDEVSTREPDDSKPQAESPRRTLHLKCSRIKRRQAITKGDSGPKITVFKRRSKGNQAEQGVDFEEELKPVEGVNELPEIKKGNDLASVASRNTEGSLPVTSTFGESLSNVDVNSSKYDDLHRDNHLTTLFDEGLDDLEEDLDLDDLSSRALSFNKIFDDFDDDQNGVDLELEQLEKVPSVDDFDFNSEDFGWEDLDDFEESASRENEDEDLALIGIKRTERARQVAVVVLGQTEWDPEYLPLLETIFTESGWGATRIAIEGLIEGGAVPEEIILARQIRSIWFNNEHLWTSFRMKSNAPFMQAEAVYKNFSWADALRLIHCFPSIPDGTEIEAFIDHIYDEWYSNDRLRRHFKAFLKYFRYQIVETKRTLPGDIGFLFSSPLEAEWGVDNPELMSAISDMRSELRELGADSGFEMSGTDNKFNILLKETFDEEKESK